MKRTPPHFEGKGRNFFFKFFVLFQFFFNLFIFQILFFKFLQKIFSTYFFQIFFVKFLVQIFCILLLVKVIETQWVLLELKASEKSLWDSMKIPPLPYSQLSCCLKRSHIWKAVQFREHCIDVSGSCAVGLLSVSLQLFSLLFKKLLLIWKVVV